MQFHAFMEFAKPVDGTGLCAAAFNGVRPNAQRTCGRGTKVKKLQLAATLRGRQSEWI